MYTAFLMMCLLDKEPSYNTCIIMNNKEIFKTELECMKSAADLLNSPPFQIAYTNFRPHKLECFEWLETGKTDL